MWPAAAAPCCFFFDGEGDPNCCKMLALLLAGLMPPTVSAASSVARTATEERLLWPRPNRLRPVDDLAAKFNRNNFGLSFSLKNFLRFPTLRKSSKMGTG